MPNLISDFIDYLRWRRTRFNEQRIERRYRIETSVPESEYLNQVQSTNKEYAVPYEPIQLDVFKNMVDRLRQVLDNPGPYRFIDLGSGKGRALIYAAEEGFEQCTGIEFSEKLHEKALSNIDSYSSLSGRNCEFSLLCMDAADFEFPDSDIVLFLYNPFSIEVMISVLGNIDRFATSSRNEMYVLYRNPTCANDFALHHLELLELQKSFQIFRVSRAE